jgi:hypothetical protein
VRGGRALLYSPDVEYGRGEIDLRPFEGDKLGRPEPIPEGQEDHGRVAVTVTVGLGSLDLAGRQVLPGSKFGVRTPGRSNYSIYFSWGDQLEVRLVHGKRPFAYGYCS